MIHYLQLATITLQVVMLLLYFTTIVILHSLSLLYYFITIASLFLIFTSLPFHSIIAILSLPRNSFSFASLSLPCLCNNSGLHSLSLLCYCYDPFLTSLHSYFITIAISGVSLLIPYLLCYRYVLRS